MRSKIANEEKENNIVLFDWRVWTNWNGEKLEAIEMLNEMLHTHSVRIHIELEQGNDFTEISIINTLKDS